MRRVCGVVLALVLAACAGGGEGGNSAQDSGAPTTTAAATGPCGLKPLDFTAEKWRASQAAPPAPGGVMWEQEFIFTNPNRVDVRLPPLVVELDLSGADGHFFKAARTVFRPVADELVPAGREQPRFAHAWLAPGSSPTTDSLFGKATATVGGAECPVPIERIVDRPVPAHVQALVSCDPQQVAAPC